MKPFQLKYILLSVLIFFIGITNAQVIDALYFDSPKDSLSQIKFNYQTAFGSSCFTNNFIQEAYSGELISKGAKESNKLKAMNFIGYESSFNLSYTSKFCTNNLAWKVALKTNEQYHAKFTKDLYNLTFFGNKNYENKTANISNSGFSMFKYQELEFGIYKKTSNNNSINTIYLGASIIKGQDFIQTNIPKGSIYTAEYGSYITADLQANAMVADTLKNKIQHFNGIGAGVKLAYNYYNKDLDLFFNFQINDIGFITYRNNSFTGKIDTSITYSGYEVENILELNERNFNLTGTDTLNYFMDKYTQTKSFNTSLPQRINFLVGKKFNKLALTIGLLNITNKITNHSLIFSNIAYQFSNKISASLTPAYGEYGNFRLGISINALIFKKIEFHGSFANVLGLVKNASIYNGFYTGIKYYL